MSPDPDCVQLRVLVVDGGSLVAHAVGDALERRGHLVTTALTVAEALAQPAPEVLVADCEVGDVSGLELFAMMRQRGPAPRTVLLSHEDSEQEERSARRLGVAHVLVKPFRIEDLIAAVENRLDAPTTYEEPPAAMMRQVYRACRDSVADAARDVAAFTLQSEIGPICRARIATAVAEVVDNARRHAYVHPEGVIELEVRVARSQVVTTVRDEGVGVDGRRLLEGVEAGAPGGLRRAASLAEGISIEGTPGLGTTVTMTFGILRSDFDETRSIDLTDWDYFTPEIARRVLETLGEENDSFFELPPALAVAVGRMLSGPRLEALRVLRRS